MSTRTVEIKVLPNSGGRVRIHWFEMCADGPISTPAGLQANQGRIEILEMRGRIACMPTVTGMSQRQANGSYLVTHRSEDPRAVTCPECAAIPAFKVAMQTMGDVAEKR